MISLGCLPRFAFTQRPKMTLLRAIISLEATYRQRRVLAEMESHRLTDIGLTKIEALDEAKRPIWDAPANWRR